jgi:hypothetical protein
VNAYDQKLIFSTTEEKDWVSILVIGGIEVFLLQNLIESIACVSDAKKRQLAVIVVEKEKDHILMPTTIE